VSLSVTVVGCAGGYPEPGNAFSSYLVRSPEATVVVDLGAGATANLLRHVTFDQVDAFVVSHSHPDHCAELTVLRNALRYYTTISDVPVYSTREVRELTEAYVGELAPTLPFTVIDASSVVEIGDLRFRFSPTDHPVETLAMRIEAGERSLVYSADTGSAWDPSSFAAGADVFLCEATMPAHLEDEAQHLTGRQAGAFARDAGAGRLILTHIPLEVGGETQRSAARSVYDGPIDLACPGATYTI
jgi:ribonuclease BN (tRNA processing enzyme)